ncbi:hypothetical protein X798_07929 [Onchocerca flexuosa]|uniref:Uncharacterized protein n=1 Tax=Onchocerca flexuosa TaxID=387005 RepID=A0A238BKB3_9BILA|nr:hypothetical protein X798_07929 [Onchocerca flexuosa]
MLNFAGHFLASSQRFTYNEKSRATHSDIGCGMDCITIGPVSSSIQYTRETMPGAQYLDDKKLNIPISKEAEIKLIERWTHQAISSIMASIATQ